MKARFTVRIKVAMASLLVLLFSACAQGANEGELLAQLQRELEGISVLVSNAQARADAGQRINFNYEALRADLRTIQLGIEQYRAGIRDQPREIPPLLGDYRN